MGLLSRIVLLFFIFLLVSCASTNIDSFTNDELREKSIKLNQLSRESSSKKDYEEAIEYEYEFLKIVQRLYGKESKEVANSYNNLGLLYYKLSAYSFNMMMKRSWKRFKHNPLYYSDKSVEYLKKALEIREKILGEEHEDTIQSYQNLGALSTVISLSKKESFKFLKKALILSEKKFKKNDKRFILLYYDVGNSYYELNKSQKALKYLNKSLALQKSLNIRNVTTAKIYEKIGEIYKKEENYSESLSFYKNSLSIYQQLTGKESSFVIRVHQEIASLYSFLMDYNKSIKQYKALLPIFRTNSSEVVNTYEAIGKNYTFLANYQEALNYYEKALLIKKRIFSKNSTHIGASYSHMGQVYFMMGAYKEALEYSRKDLTITEKNFGKNDKRTATMYNNMALLYEELGDNINALEFFKKALKVFEKRQNSTTANLYDNLATCYMSLRQKEKAFNYLKKALKLKKKIWGDTHLNTALTYANFSTYYHLTTHDKLELIYLEKAIKIYEDKLGKEHPQTALLYLSMGRLSLLQFKNKKAYEYIKKALHINQKNTPINKSQLIESYLTMGLYYQVTKNYEESYKYIKLAIQIFLKNKNQIVDILSNRQKGNYLIKNKILIDDFLNSTTLYLNKLKKENRQKEFQKIVSSSINLWLSYKGTLFEYQNILSMVENKIETEAIIKNIRALRRLTKKLSHLERQKSSHSNFKKNQKSIDIIRKKIVKIEISLSKNNEIKALLKQLGLKNIKIETIAKNLERKQLYIDFFATNKNYYIFTLNKNNQINFIQIDEEDSKSLDENIKKIKSNNKKMAQATDNKTIEQKREKLKKESQAIFSKLYTTLISKYLAKELKDKESLIISPDGLLNSLPFEALYHNGRYLIQDYQISYISSGREFVRQTKREKAEPKYEMICFGDPDFNTTLPISNIKKLGKQDRTKKLDTWEQYTSFSPLGNAEIEMIRELYKSDTLIYEGKRATVNNLMSIKSPKILHLSTHGKFLDNPNILNPMLRAGLAFSGANRSLDGIVTALKLSALDLKDTELVVLSACESGLGKIQNAEGVVGLPKAFLQAGARNVVMSLWSVSNWETTQLMKYFYENINKGQTYSTALRNAKIKMIDMHPYYWSAFIIHGIQN